jgi:putative heme iron utilization protein
MEVLVDEVFPELNFCPGEIVHLSPTEVLAVLHPERVDQVVALFLRFGGLTFVILKKKIKLY